jgi:hypothetical protein
MRITEGNPIAEEKLKKNIAEFIIHMYQMEDLCRVYEFNLEEIKQYVISHFPVEEAVKSRIAVWFEKIIEKMHTQNIMETGHLLEVQEYVDKLLELKLQLLTEDESFMRIYNAARPHIREIIEASDNTITSDIQVCLNGIYGLLLARMNGKEVPENLNEPLNTFGEVLSYLSYKYRQENFLSSN